MIVTRSLTELPPSAAATVGASGVIPTTWYMATAPDVASSAPNCTKPSGVGRALDTGEHRDLGPLVLLRVRVAEQAPVEVVRDGGLDVDEDPAAAVLVQQQAVLRARGR